MCLTSKNRNINEDTLRGALSSVTKEWLMKIASPHKSMGIDADMPHGAQGSSDKLVVADPSEHYLSYGGNKEN